jgi:hypothetical protein
MLMQNRNVAALTLLQSLNVRRCVAYGGTLGTRTITLTNRVHAEKLPGAADREALFA